MDLYSLITFQPLPRSAPGAELTGYNFIDSAPWPLRFRFVRNGLYAPLSIQLFKNLAMTSNAKQGRARQKMRQLQRTRPHPESLGDLHRYQRTHNRGRLAEQYQPGRRRL